MPRPRLLIPLEADGIRETGIKRNGVLRLNFASRGMTDINVVNRQRGLRVNIKSLEVFAREALKLCLQLPARDSSLQNLDMVDVVLVSDKRIADIHERFMRVTGPTDVITFEHGEIVISVETASRHARSLRSTTGSELRLYIVHGLLHLHGFDDRTARDAARMARTQDRILAQAV